MNYFKPLQLIVALCAGAWAFAASSAFARRRS